MVSPFNPSLPFAADIPIVVFMIPHTCCNFSTDFRLTAEACISAPDKKGRGYLFSVPAPASGGYHLLREDWDARRVVQLH
jgi:hypothetical protein